MGADQPADMDSLCAILAIHTLNARYSRCVETLGCAGLHKLLMSDGILHFTGSQDAPLRPEASISFITSGMEESTSRLGLKTSHGCAHCYETYARADAGWRISSLRLAPQWVNAALAGHSYPHDQQHRGTAQ